MKVKMVPVVDDYNQLYAWKLLTVCLAILIHLLFISKIPKCSGGLGVLGGDRPLWEQPGAPDVSRSRLFLQGALEGSGELRCMYCICQEPCPESFR